MTRRSIFPPAAADPRGDDDEAALDAARRLEPGALGGLQRAPTPFAGGASLSVTATQGQDAIVLSAPALLDPFLGEEAATLYYESGGVWHVVELLFDGAAWVLNAPEWEAPTGTYELFLAPPGDASGLGALAWGPGSLAAAPYSVALGQGTAAGFFSTVLGENCQALGQGAMAEGIGSRAVGYASYAGGLLGQAASNVWARGLVPTGGTGHVVQTLITGGGANLLNTNPTLLLNYQLDVTTVLRVEGQVAVFRLSDGAVQTGSFSCAVARGAAGNAALSNAVIAWDGGNTTHGTLALGVNGYGFTVTATQATGVSRLWGVEIRALEIAPRP